MFQSDPNIILSSARKEYFYPSRQEVLQLVVISTSKLLEHHPLYLSHCEISCEYLLEDSLARYIYIYSDWLVVSCEEEELGSRLV